MPKHGGDGHPRLLALEDGKSRANSNTFAIHNTSS